MLKQLANDRTNYFDVFDKLVKFQEASCGTLAPTAPWLKLVSMGSSVNLEVFWELILYMPPCCLNIHIGFNYPLLLQEAQKSELRDIYVECTKMDVRVNNMMSRARPNQEITYSIQSCITQKNSLMPIIQ